MKSKQSYITMAVFLSFVLLVASCDRLSAPGENSTPASAAESTPVSIVEPSGATFAVQRGMVTNQLEFDGRISPVEETPLYFQSPGFVKQVHVKRGDQVNIGDLLAELETADLQNQIAQAELALDSAQLLLSETEKLKEQEIAVGELDLELAQTTLAQAKVANAFAINQAELALALAQEQLTQTKALEVAYNANVAVARIAVTRGQEAVGNAEYELQKARDRIWEEPEVAEAYAYELQQARWDLESAQAVYQGAVAAASTEREAFPSVLRAQEIVVQQAEEALVQLKEGVDPALSLAVKRAQQALDALKAASVDPALVNDVNGAELALQGLQDQLAYAQIFASVDGEVLSLSVRPGRLIEAFSPVMIIADPSIVEVTADPPSDYLMDITEGQEATVALGTDPNRTWSGTVLSLPYPYGAASDTESDLDNDQSVRVSLEGGTSDVRPGDLVRVTIVLEEKDDALWLSPAAVRVYQGSHFVIVQEDGRQRRADVKVGIEGQSQVEILHGLKEGQVVVAP